MQINKNKTIIFCTCLILVFLASSGCNILNLDQTQETGFNPPVTSTALPSVISTPLPSMTSDSLKLFYADEFNNPDSGWVVSAKNDVSFSYVNEEYNVSVSDSNMLHSSSNEAVGTQDNFVVEVDARVLSSADTSKYGVYFRRTDSGDFYTFVITGNHYSVSKYFQGDWYYLQNSTTSKYILTDGSKNTLKIACLGSIIEVYVNGQRLATLDDDSLTSGKISLMASEANTSVVFDNFQLYLFTNTYLASADPDIPIIDNVSMPDGEVGVNYQEILTSSGSTPPYSWTLSGGILPEGLSLAGSTGTVSGTPTMEGKYDFTIKLTSSIGETTQKMSVYISELVIATDSLASSILNVNYVQELQASGGQAPYTWSIISGNLPDGLVLNAATGAITGIPTRSGGPITHVFNVSDGAGASAAVGLSLTIKLGDFQVIDQYVLDTPGSAGTSIQTLVNYLVIPCTTDIEKTRAIYDWIAQNIDYDVYTFISGLYKTPNCPDQSAEAVFSRRDGICEGYANLFVKMAGYAGLQTAKVLGWGRVDYTNEGYTKDHAWNAVKIGGKWQLLDATWGAGYNDENNKFVRSFDDFWFLTPPDQFVYTHYPNESSWQLLTPIVPVDIVAQYPVIKTAYFSYGLNFGDNDQGFYSINSGNGLMSIQAPPDVLLMAELYQNDNPLKKMTFCQRQDNIYQINIGVPKAGDYELRIYAKQKSESGLYHQAIVYKLTSNQSTYNKVTFATAYELFKTSGAYLYSPKTDNLQIGLSYKFKITVPGAKVIALISDANSPSQTIQTFTKQGQTFEGDFTIPTGKYYIAAQFADDTNNWSWLLAYQDK
jgi:transglutaminase/protease-like cytokinesis protein 3